MRKNSARKLLHGILDLLPVILIPVFMIYSHRHIIDSYSVTVTTDKFVPLYESNDVNDWSDLQSNKIYLSETLELDSTFGDYGFGLFIISYENASFRYNSTYSDEFDLAPYSANINNGLSLTFSENEIYLYFTNSNAYTSLGLVYGYINFDNVIYYISDDGSSVGQFQDYCIDFGNSLPYKTDYQVYEYQKGVTTTYNDTDIGSQFIYCLYNSVDKYFNMNNVFNMNNIYDWFSLNIFNGNPPLAIYIVWNIVLYEFVMDLLFLLYALFMFFIDSCTNLMDRFYCNLSGRR